MSMSSNDSFCFLHVAPIINYGEYKTKPIQHSLEKLRSYGIIPNMLIIRTPGDLSEEHIDKLELFSNIRREFIIQNTDVKNIYYVPELFKKQLIVPKICKILDLEYGNYNLDNYYKILDHFDKCNKEIKLGIIGKYLNTPDTYLSIIRAIECAGIELNVKVNIQWVTEKDDLGQYNCFIIPGGFGSRGISDKMKIAEYCRINKIPVLGICLGMQIMVVDCFNSVSEIKGTSTEWDNKDNLYSVIDILPNQNGKMGGTMRLGNFETELVPSKVKDLYGKNVIIERHRHRYEVNNKYVDEIEKSGLKFVGYGTINNDKLMEIVELDNHPFYIGCQYHPEFNSKYNQPNPLFIGLLEAAIHISC